MIALSIHREHLAEILAGRKSIELRSRRTRHRGPLLICSTGRRTPADEATGLPAGVQVLVVELVDCRPMEPADAPEACSPFQAGLYAWMLANPRRVHPVPVCGRQGLFHVPDAPIAAESASPAYPTQADRPGPGRPAIEAAGSGRRADRGT